jgi:hypothetical protein
MGKRELLIIVIFAAVIAVAYELTVPPAKEGEGFSFRRFLKGARREMQGNQPIVQHTATGVIAVKGHVTELRLASVPRGVQVIGESRDDIAYELVVESSGPDQPTALEYAKRTTIKTDDLGTSLALNVSYPHEATQWTALTVRVPSRLAVQVMGPGTGGVRAENLAALKLDRVTGIATAERIAGEVTGVLTGNELTVVGAGSVNLTLSSSRARFSKISRGLTLNVRRGRCEISGSQGPVTIEESEAEVLVNDHAGPVRTTGGGGRITIENPRQSVTVEVRSAPVTVTLRDAVPVSVFANGERVRLLLDGTPIVTLDAAATGRVDATDFGLTPEAPGPDQEQRLTHAFGKSNAPRVTLRNSRGEIVIGKRK